MVRVKLSAGDPVAAERLARTALEIHLKIDPNTLSSGWGYNLLGKALLAQDRIAEALAAYQRSLAIWRKACPPNHRNVIRVYGECIEVLERAREKSELAALLPNPDALVDLASSMRADALGPPVVPETAVRYADFRAIYDGLAIEYRNAGKVDLAQVAEQRGAALSRDLGGHDFDAPELRVAVDLETLRAQVVRGDHAGAMELCRGLLNLAPTDIRLLHVAAWMFANSPRAQERDVGIAVALAKRANELKPNDPDVLNTLGVARYRQGDYAAAVTDFEHSIALGGDDAWNHFFLAMAHQRLGHAAEARSYYDRGVAWMDKNHPHDAEMLRFRAEAAELLQIPQTPPATAPSP
jgi:tetratricopeptide (TPR) repeat protein